MKTKSKNKLLIILGIIILLALIIFFVFFLIKDSNNVSKSFPYWLEAEERNVDDDISIQFDYIDVGKISSYKGEAYDEIGVTIKNNSDRGTAYGKSYFIDYLYEGKWYMVYRPDSVQTISFILPEHSTVEEIFQLPSGVFAELGIYRMYIGDIGYCEIDIMIPLYD